MRTVKVKNVEIGAGSPKIAIPIVGKKLADLKREVSLVRNLPADLIEWRVDFLEKGDDPGIVGQAAEKLRTWIPDLPVLFTFRTADEGGEKAILPENYVTLNRKMIRSGLIDLVDVELFRGDAVVHKIVEEAHQYGVKVILSNHEFHKTPRVEEIIRRLCLMQTLGADISKIAVMPESADDVLVLLRATNLMRTTFADRPFITMSMSGQGVVSRLTGELFGSALSFGCAEKPSAPGQVRADQLAGLLNFFHQQSAR
ncbi:type I 3-dehydroquinate dehydratase [Sporolactobacillus vineae]|uniref:type I 3-dehydroquinate dehydratase n=1 Tax=Sporolactobacillus vineae TaxID=444463 RepID=UPI00028885E4|nr:type I 3-dehydroquinate dehydratase [Sporolactobacillus vineae]